MRQSGPILLFVAIVVAAAALARPAPSTAQVPLIVLPTPVKPTPTPTPTPVPSSASPPVLVPAGKRSAVYVLAAVPDATVATAVTLEVAMKIGPALASFGTPPPQPAGTTYEPPMIIPQPTWTADELQRQCVNYPATTRGAIIVGPVESDSGVFNALLFANTYVRLSAAAFLVTCNAGDPTGKRIESDVDCAKAPNHSGCPAVCSIKPTSDSCPPHLEIAWASSKFVRGNGNQAGLPFLPIIVYGAYVASRTATITAPTTTNVLHDPATTTTTVSNGGTSSTVTGSTTGTTTGTTSGTSTGTTTTTTTGAPTTNTTTAVAAGGNTTTKTSQSSVSNNGIVASSLTAMFAYANDFATTTFPGAPPSTLLKRASANIANDVSSQLIAACQKKDPAAPASAYDACANLFLK